MGDKPSNGGKITPREFYEALMDSNKERAAMERRIMAAIEKQNGHFDKKFESLEGVPARVEKLETAETRWKVAQVFVSGIIGGIMGYFARGK